jgi:hypothetical protein
MTLKKFNTGVVLIIKEDDNREQIRAKSFFEALIFESVSCLANNKSEGL